MNRARRIEAILGVVAMTLLIAIGLVVLRDNREIGPIVPDTQVTMSSAPMLQGPCGFWCKWVAGWLASKAAEWMSNEVEHNGCNGPCGGGGGGGFECGPDEYDSHCRSVL